MPSLLLLGRCLSVLTLGLLQFVWILTPPATRGMEAQEREIHFDPDEGAEVSKRFEVEASIELDDLRAELGGETLDFATFGLEISEGAHLGYLLATTDVYERVGDGRPEVLLRTYDEFEFENVSLEGANDLVGNRVRFTWDEEAEAYERVPVDAIDVDAELLEFLAEDLDLRALLPDGNVSPGDSWRVTGLTLLGLLHPGVDVGAAREAANGAVPPRELEATDEILEHLETICWYEGDEGDLLEIRFEVDPVEVDLGEAEFSGDAQGWNPLEGAEIETREFLLEFAVEGSCLWDPGSGRFRSFEARCEGFVEFEASVRFPEADLDFEISAEASLELVTTAQADP